jgi:DNA-directed RNA polymerase sigma subunit (sigma70/sigma32)
MLINGTNWKPSRHAVGYSCRARRSQRRISRRAAARPLTLEELAEFGIGRERVRQIRCVP